MKQFRGNSYFSTYMVGRLQRVLCTRLRSFARLAAMATAVPFVVVGGGIAGVSVVEELLRQRDGLPTQGTRPACHVLLISASRQLKGVRVPRRRCWLQRPVLTCAPQRLAHRLKT